MNTRTYWILVTLTLAALIIALVRPVLVLEPYYFIVDRLQPYAKPPAQDPMAGSPLSPTTIDLSSISFDVPTSTHDDNKAIVPSPTSVMFRNHIIIPRMGVDSDVIVSDSPQSLLQGLWHIPGSAVPGQEGNIVISAHRWLHRPPNPQTFYLIDTLQNGDPIYYEYGDKRYEYTVTKHLVVKPEDVYILAQDENKLTLFTCTPLFSTKERYVVSASLARISPISVD